MLVMNICFYKNDNCSKSFLILQGTLFGVKWDRLVLDEAHVTRNYKSKMSEAVCQLNGNKRWALTGTPIQNKELDVYALFKFLKCSPFDDLAVCNILHYNFYNIF